MPMSPAWNFPLRKERDEHEHATGQPPAELHREQREHAMVPSGVVHRLACAASRSRVGVSSLAGLLERAADPR